MRMYDKLGNAIDLIDKQNYTVIDCHLGVGQSLTNAGLKDCDYIICQFNANDWNMTITSFGKYTLNTYGSISCGVMYLKASGYVKNQHCSDSAMFIDKIIGFKRT